MSPRKQKVLFRRLPFLPYDEVTFSKVLVISSSKNGLSTLEDEFVGTRGCVAADFIGISGREALQQAFFEPNAESAPVRWTEAVDVDRKHPSINGAYTDSLTVLRES